MNPWELKEANGNPGVVGAADSTGSRRVGNKEEELEMPEACTEKVAALVVKITGKFKAKGPGKFVTTGKNLDCCREVPPSLTVIVKAQFSTGGFVAGPKY